MIDKDKTYRTRDGREVRLYATDGMLPYPVHGAIKVPKGWDDTAWTAEGAFLNREKNGNDLIEVKPRIKRTVWLNIGKGPIGCYYNSKELANVSKTLTEACVKVDLDFEEGEGL